MRMKLLLKKGLITINLLRESGPPSFLTLLLVRRELEPLVPSPWGEGWGEGEGFTQEI